jgi:hypothetical protein
MLLYGCAIFAGAFLLFAIQPMVAKAILPWFGGTAAVWTTCLLFFQAALAGGYWYAHRLARRPAPQQARVHLALLAASVLFLPVVPAERWRGAGDPALHILGLLGACVGLPYFLLAAGSPLLQAWYARARPGASPYRLYALSNLASVLALVSYPVLVEPFLSTGWQLRAWSAAYAAFAASTAAIALRLARTPEAVPEAARRGQAGRPPSWGLQLLWMALSATACILLLAVTNHLTKDVAPVPFLWLLPLTLYLLTLILCFEREEWYVRGWYLRLLPLALAGMICGISGLGLVINIRTILFLFCGGLTVCCLVCHGELVRLKPEPAHLTSFYLMIALGGAGGGIFVGLVAPRLFRGYWELPAGMVLCAFLAVVTACRETRYRLLGPALAAPALGVLAWTITSTGGFVKPARLVVRDFYGVLRVSDVDLGTMAARRVLTHGAINHGEQLLDATLRREPTTYYGRSSGVGLAILQTRGEVPQRVGVIGLGAGTLASYGRPGDSYRFYELDPVVLHLARTEFTFLPDCRAQSEVVLGDARLSLESEPPQQFDVLAVDAFSGDSVPVHLLTKEALALYFRHLRPNGILALHVSSKYLDLASVAVSAARDLGKRTFVVTDQAEENPFLLRSNWVLAGNSPAALDRPELSGVADPETRLRHVRAWTDQYSNLIGLLR